LQRVPVTSTPRLVALAVASIIEECCEEILGNRRALLNWKSALKIAQLLSQYLAQLRQLFEASMTS
jgi:hypothetical protein